MTWRKV